MEAAAAGWAGEIAVREVETGDPDIWAPRNCRK